MVKRLVLFFLVVMCLVMTGCKSECNHKWDEGVVIAGGIGAYEMEYTCRWCGKKTRTIVTFSLREC